jgi:hypothetical protein
MAYVLIGYTINAGSMTKDGQNITWDNRIIRFITDSGSSDFDIGFSPFQQKFKVDELTKFLHVQPNLVNDTLNHLLNKKVDVVFGPVDGVLQVKSFRLYDDKTA